MVYSYFSFVSQVLETVNFHFNDIFSLFPVPVKSISLIKLLLVQQQFSEKSRLLENERISSLETENMFFEQINFPGFWPDEQSIRYRFNESENVFTVLTITMVVR